jgi:hypothetical protein
MTCWNWCGIRSTAEKSSDRELCRSRKLGGLSSENTNVKRLSKVDQSNDEWVERWAARWYIKKCIIRGRTIDLAISGLDQNTEADSSLGDSWSNGRTQRSCNAPCWIWGSRTPRPPFERGWHIDAMLWKHAIGEEGGHSRLEFGKEGQGDWSYAQYMP